MTHNTPELPVFEIADTGIISREFINRGISDFKNAAAFIAGLPYARNTDKNNLVTVFSENCGTCSTKHALLKELANENNFKELKLFTGLFKMNPLNTPEVAKTLIKHNLEFIPEAHNYLRYNNHLLDFTKINFKLSEHKDDLMEEMEITPDQVTDTKVAYHKTYLKKWLKENQHIRYTLPELWEIREQCIRDLAAIER